LIIDDLLLIIGNEKKIPNYTFQILDSLAFILFKCVTMSYCVPDVSTTVPRQKVKWARIGGKL